MPSGFCFTVDLDRDVNLQVPGQVAAGSMDRGQGTAPRFDSTLKGLQLLVGLLDDIGLPCTFFCEGRTLEVIRDHAGMLDGFDIGVHGYDHECLSEMTGAEVEAVLSRAVSVVKDVTGRTPSSFRAPYMSSPGDMIPLLGRVGVKIDSSVYAGPTRCVPYEAGSGVVELPVTEGRDQAGRKISAYLWPMHEGKRAPGDYALLSTHVPDEGVFVLADHTWHMVESRSRGIFEHDDLAHNISLTRDALQSILDTGVLPMTAAEVAVRAHHRRP